MAPTHLLVNECGCVTAGISEEGNLCVTVNVTTEEASYTCTSEQDLILWRVGSRQIAGTVVEVNGVEVNTTTLPGEGYSSTIVFTPTFLEDMADGSEIEVACLVQRGLFQIVEADTRTLVVFSKLHPLKERERVLGGAVAEPSSRMMRVQLHITSCSW